MNTREIFGERLGELIAEKASHENFSKELLCQTLGIEVSLLYKYLRKEVLPFTERAIQLADFFECSLDFLCGRVNEYLVRTFAPSKPFSQCFQKIIKEKGFSRYRLKKELPFSKQSIDDWFFGIRIPSIENLTILAEYFDCTIDYLVGREN